MIARWSGCLGVAIATESLNIQQQFCSSQAEASLGRIESIVEESPILVDGTMNKVLLENALVKKSHNLIEA